jgi:hypothetical protein
MLFHHLHTVDRRIAPRGAFDVQSLIVLQVVAMLTNITPLKERETRHDGVEIADAGRFYSTTQKKSSLSRFSA